MKVLAPALALLLAGCMKNALPAPEKEGLGIIGVRVWAEQLQRGYGYSGTSRSQAADIVWFVRLPEGETSLRVKEAIKSEFNQGSINYAFNLKPGRYAVVAAAANRAGKEIHTYFPKECVQQSIVELKAGGIAYCGDIRARVTYDLSKGDAVAMHYLRKIDPKFYAASVGGRMISRTDAQMVRTFEVRRGKEQLEYFRDRSRRLLEETTWRRVLPKD